MQSAQVSTGLGACTPRAGTEPRTSGGRGHGGLTHPDLTLPPCSTAVAICTQGKLHRHMLRRKAGSSRACCRRRRHHTSQQDSVTEGYGDSKRCACQRQASS